MKTHNSLSVDWRDRDLRDDWSIEYVPVGSLPGVIRGISGVGSTGVGSKLLSQTAFLTRRNRRIEDVGEHARRVAGLLAKFLQRGVVPLPTLGIERAALEHHGLMDEVDDLSERGIELGWVARRGGRLAAGGRKSVDGEHLRIQRRTNVPRLVRVFVVGRFKGRGWSVCGRLRVSIAVSVWCRLPWISVWNTLRSSPRADRTAR